MPTSGRCLCGAVRISADGVSPHASACHCGMCRRWCGGGPLFAVASASIAIEGEDSVGVYTSSDWAERAFCKQCGTSLFYRFRGSPRVFLSAGVLDDLSGVELSREIFVDRKPGLYALAGEHPRLTEAETLALFQKKDGT